MRAILQVADDVIERRRALPREPARDLDQLADVGDALRPVFLSHHDDIEVRFPDDILKDFRSSRRIAPLDPVLQQLVA
jgi:hypothetical protein